MIVAHRTVAAVLVAVVLTGLVLGGCTSSDEDDGAARAAAEFLAAWQAGDLQSAGAHTDAPADAQALLTETTETLRVDAARLQAGEVQPAGDDEARRTVPFRAELDLASLGTWTYDGVVTVQRIGDGDQWQVDWSPDVLHPQLTAETRLSRERQLPERAPILDRVGQPLMEPRPVVEIGVEPGKLIDAAAAYTSLGSILAVDVDALRSRVGAATTPEAFVDVITLREPDYAPVAAALREIPGVITRPATRTLAPTASFARPVLGTVSPATEETLANAGPTASTVDQVGRSGLQYAYQQQLAGTPSGQVLLVNRADEQRRATLHGFTGRSGTPLQTTLDLDVQDAAEQALAEIPTPAALVAVDATTGSILAAANGPGGSDGVERALAGQYPPGSTFKVVTTTALLAGGLPPDEIVPCPREAVIDGKSFDNAGEFELGDVPFRRDFAESCNTAFVSLANRLEATSLTDTARSFGVGGAWSLPVRSFAGEVPPASSTVDRAAAAIGQGRVLASPLGMAMVAATVQSGRFVAPSLVSAAAGDTATSSAPAPVPPLDPAIVDTLRSLMRETVTDGTASALQLPGSPVYAKTGTAEFGSEDPPRTHAWTVGYRDQLAFAVLVEDARGGGSDAAPVAAAFLESLG